MYSIIIPSFNEGVHLRGVIEAIRKNTQEEHEIIVIDDASTDGSSSGLEGVNLLYNPERWGSIRSRNIGAREAKGDILVFIDAHVYPEPRWLSNIPVREGVFYTGAIFSYYNPSNWRVYGGSLTDDLNLLFRTVEPDSSGEVAVAPGAFIVVGKKTFFSAGMFDSGLKLWGFEDSELGIRAWVLGYKIVCIPEAEVSHVFSQNIAGANRPFPSREFEYRHNQLRTAYLHLDKRRIGNIKRHIDPGSLLTLEQAVFSEEYYKRKRELENNRKYSIDWYMSKFGITW